MRAKFGTLFMALGVFLLIGSAALFALNEREAMEADMSAKELLPRLIEQIQVDTEAEGSAPDAELPLGGLELPDAYLDAKDFVMTELEIDDHNYIGYLSIPKLALDLPVMSRWNYSNLKLSPCRYYGALKTDNLVIMAHNYDKHFGRIDELMPGDTLFFVDVKGDVTGFEVIARDVLSATAVDEMTSGDYDLTLFTCTYSGQDRVTVFCDKITK